MLSVRNFLRGAIGMCCGAKSSDGLIKGFQGHLNESQVWLRRICVGYIMR
jgi:hypothetical protein